ncbi:MAG: hypothetical protein U0103_03845 [Candidatus Obscuribacterales bacterium]|nr:DUF4388 domain-containing protein [Cyanobacteria bacterium SZAS LIN-5]RTL46148.1 MAG: DUF4388 domain-containing protein [Candidatus Melainabacteria bacterium]
MPKVRLLTQGKIWANRTTREILWSVMKYKKVAVGVLHVLGPHDTIEGEICILNGIFVVGGKLKNGKADGYAAIRTLLMLKDGKFEYLDYSEVDVPDLNQGLKIRLTQLINKLPDLPVSLEELMGANTLNRMRSFEAGQPPSEEALIDKDTFAQLQNWEARTMRLRAAAFWALFVVISGIAGLLYYFH